MADLDKVLDTQAKRQAVIAALRNLQTQEGWAFVKGVMLEWVQILQDQINDTEVEIDDKQLWRMKVKRKYVEQLLNLPDRMISEIANPETKNILDMDPYE